MPQSPGVCRWNPDKSCLLRRGFLVLGDGVVSPRRPRGYLRRVPYHIEREHADCEDSKPYAVVKDSDGEVMGCHETRQEAEDQVAALYASEEDESSVAAATVVVVGDQEGEAEAADVVPRRFESDLVPEGIPTDDGRFMALGSLSWREPPLTLLVLDENTEGGHLGAVACGHIDAISKHGLSATSAVVVGSGAMDSGELGQETARRVEEGTLGGVSVDLAIREWGARDPDTGEIIASEDLSEDEWMRLFMGGLQFAVLDGVIGAATIVPFPAFADARIVMLASGELVRVDEEILAAGRSGLVEVAGELHMLVTTPFSLTPPRELRACAAGPLSPPAEWFADPKLSAPTVLTVTADGRVFGHVATWDCHNGYADRCLRLYPSSNGYAYFHTGQMETAGGDLVRVGRITVKPHAPRGASMSAVSAHYDDARRVAAFVRLYDDEFGVACAGVTRSDAKPELLRDFLANPPSIDARRGEILGISSVPVPGLPVVSPEARLVAGADGEAEVEMLLLPPVTAEALAASGEPEDAFERADEAAAAEAIQALGETFEAGPEETARALAETFR